MFYVCFHLTQPGLLRSLASSLDRHFLQHFPMVRARGWPDAVNTCQHMPATTIEMVWNQPNHPLNVADTMLWFTLIIWKPNARHTDWELVQIGTESDQESDQEWTKWTDHLTHAPVDLIYQSSSTYGLVVFLSYIHHISIHLWMFREGRHDPVILLWLGWFCLDGRSGLEKLLRGASCSKLDASSMHWSEHGKKKTAKQHNHT